MHIRKDITFFIMEKKRKEIYKKTDNYLLKYILPILNFTTF